MEFQNQHTNLTNRIKVMTELEQQTYVSTVFNVLEVYPYERMNRKFEMSIDMCDSIDWSHEDECGNIFDSIIGEVG